jgi:hypothetical protein
MNRLIEQIDKYLTVQEKKERISLSINISNDLKDIIELVRKSEDREKTISMFSEEIQKEIQKFIEGGIL